MSPPSSQPDLTAPFATGTLVAMSLSGNEDVARARMRTPLLPICTLVVWVGCCVVGGLGLVLHYRRPHPAPKPPEPVQAQLLNVELTSDPVPPPDASSPPSDPATPPPLLQPAAVPEAPPLLAVSEPSPAIAFALPVDAPARIVPASQASYAQAAPSTIPAQPAMQAQPLTFGQGEGKQPAPEYPFRAMREGQEGSVDVRFSVGEDGRVMAAEVMTPSAWPLLNDAAVRTIRERWRFRAGPARLYYVSIHFQLKK